MHIPHPRISTKTIWQEVDGFPGYSVSNTGLVRNDRFDRLLQEQINQVGLVYVGLTKGRVQHRLSVPLLVARTFLPPHPRPHYNTPINLDGQRQNNHVENLMWRPRWFAMKYHRQFIRPPAGDVYPIEDMGTLEQFSDVWDVVKRYGLLFHEVLVNAANNTNHGRPSDGVWPTGQHFRYVTKTTIIPQLHRSL